MSDMSVLTKYDHEAFFVSIPLISLCTLCMILILITLLYHFYLLKQSKLLMGFIRRTTILCMCSCVLCASCDLHGTVYCFINDKDFSDRSMIHEFSKKLGNIFYFVTTTTLFCIFIGRLYYTLSDTIYKLSHSFLIFYFVLMGMSILGMALVLTLEWVVAIAWSLFVIILNDTALNVMCIFVFIRKLRAISISPDEEFQMITVLNSPTGGRSQDKLTNFDIHTTHYDKFIKFKGQSMDSSSLNTNDDNEMNLINIIMRHSILSCTSICVNQCLYVVLVAIVLHSPYVHSHKAWNDMYQLEYCIRSIYLLVNCVILYLNLNINHWLYYIICKKCHLCCYRCCIPKDGELDEVMRDTEYNYQRI